MESVSADHLTNFFGAVFRCDELLSFCGIDTEEARILDRRRADAELDFLSAGITKQIDDDAAGGAANDRVIDQDDALPGYVHADRVQLHADSAFTFLLPRLDEGAAHVFIFQKTFYEGDAGSLGIAKGCHVAGVRYAHDHVAVELALFPKLFAHVQAGLVNVLAIHDGVRASKINVFEGADAMLVGIHRAIHGGADAIVIDGNDFTGENVSHKFGIDGIQRRGLGGQDPAGFRLAEHQRAVAEWIAAAVESVVRASYDSIGAMDFVHQFFELFFFRSAAASSQEFDDDFRIHGGGECGAFQEEAAAESQRIDQVAIVSQCHGAVDAVCLQWLHIGGNGRAGGGVTHMADADVAFLFRQIAEYFGYKTHAAEGLHHLAVGGGDAGTFLSAMLQSKDAVVHFVHCRQLAIKNAKDTTFFMRLVIIDIHTFVHSGILLTVCKYHF